MTKTNRTLPGDMPIEQEIKQMIRVNHAGEFGAKRIYEGQLAALKNSESYPTIKHMLEQELEHLAKFEQLAVERRVRPTALMPIWNVAGFALGYITGKLGERAAMACTVAVEEVIDEHYREQLEKLPDSEPELKKDIEKFRAEELEHRDIGLENEAQKTPFYPIITTAVTLGSKAAIWLSKRV
jgi:ubiquinone biosynthesis monooxygenase Coq7